MGGGGRKRKIKQIAGVNLQQETNNLHAHMWNQLSFFQRSKCQRLQTHLSTLLSFLDVLTALPANGNKDDSVKGEVETSEEMQDQEENIPAP